jgi:hypothetical protein
MLLIILNQMKIFLLPLKKNEQAIKIFFFDKNISNYIRFGSPAFFVKNYFLN